MVATTLLVALCVAGALSAPSSEPHQPSRRTTAPAGSRPLIQPRPHASGRAHADLARARQAAVRFLASYLRFAYGQAPARSVAPVSPAIRGQLVRGSASVTPAERRRHPRVVALQVVAARARLARATALVADGGVTSYAVRVTLRRGRFGWVASAIGG